MNQIAKIAILGGNGRAGKFLVNQLLKKGYVVKLLIRNTANFSINHPSIEIIQGDALDSRKIDLLVRDCEVVINTMSQRPGEPLVSSKATASVIKSMKKHLVKRIFVLAGLNIDTPSDCKSEQTSLATAWVKSNFKAAHDDKQKSFSILSKSELDWTMVRVPMINFKKSDDAPVFVDLKDCKGDKVSASSIGAFIAKQMEGDEFIKKATFIWNA